MQRKDPGRNREHEEALDLMKGKCDWATEGKIEGGTRNKAGASRKDRS